jgi:nucleoside-diphosphate-sugar epimerase
VSAVLVSGATTPVGRALVRTLIEEGRAVLAVAVEEEWPFEPHENLHYHRVDLTRGRRIRELLFGPARELAVTAIVHSAHHRRTTDRGKHIHALNVESTREMLHLA